MSGRPPYLSVVATSRNDDHGGKMLERMQLFVNGLTAQCDRHRLDCELVLVDWNPPTDRAGLADALTWPAGEGYLAVRVIQVPHSYHAKLAHSDKLPLFQMIAKNVGIRRARALFVLATNVDVLLSEPLMEALARRDLDPSTLYRADRYDISDGIDPFWPIEAQLVYCESHVTLVNELEGSRDLRTGHFDRVQPPQLRWTKRAPRRVRAAARVLVYSWYSVRRSVRRFIAGADGPSSAPGSSARPGLLETARRKALAVEDAWNGELANLRLHTNASGDFTLMSREAWIKAGGYPELEMYSMHLDGLILYQAHYAGIAEIDLPYPLYHVEHGGGFRPQANGGNPLYRRLDEAGIPRITDDQLRAWIREMRKKGRPIPFNDESWGLAHETLPERDIELAPAVPTTAGDAR
jgi:hypothetical protein